MSNFIKKNPILTVIIPTFNEKDNIEKIVKKLELTLTEFNFQILFVDDNSQDGTIQIIRSIERKNPKVSFFIRIGRRCLSGACIEGILIVKI